MWRFANHRVADEHALIQYGDAILRGPDDLVRSYRPLELGRLFTRIGMSDRFEVVSKATGARLREFCEELWEHLVPFSKDPPSDPAEVLTIVAADRRATRQGGVVHRSPPTEKENAMTENAETETNAEAKTRPAARSAKYEDTSVISFGTDKEGKQYGPQADGSFHNAKRSGSAAHTRFALMQPGQTVKEALDAGVTRADLNWDIKQGFIILQ